MQNKKCCKSAHKIEVTHNTTNCVRWILALDIILNVYRLYFQNEVQDDTIPFILIYFYRVLKLGLLKILNRDQ